MLLIRASIPIGNILPIARLSRSANFRTKSDQNLRSNRTHWTGYHTPKFYQHLTDHKKNTY